MRVFLPFVLACLAGCVAPRPLTGPELVAYLESQCPQVLVRDGIEIHAALDETARAAWAENAAREDALVRKLFQCEGAARVPVFLLALDVEAKPNEGVGAGEFEGLAFAEDLLVMYVPRDTTDSFARALLRSPTLRHELAHVHARRLGLTGPKWFREGLALEIEFGDFDGDEWQAAVFPAELARARELVQCDARRAVEGWRDDVALGGSELTDRYALSLSLVRFLFERTPGPSFLERARSVSATRVPDVEREWLAWLASLDGVEALAQAGRSASATRRDHASGTLANRGEGGLRELHTRRGDELALSWLCDPELAPGAAAFLVYYRPKQLLPSDLERLANASPRERLVAQALHSARGEPFDLAAARTALAALDPSEKLMLQLVLAKLPGVR